MTSEETMKLLRAITAVYPNYNPKDMKDTAEIWTMILADLPFSAVFAAFRSYTDEGHEFAPNAGQLRALLKNVTSTEMSDGEAWGLVLKAMQRSTYYSQEEFDKLPEDVQKAIGSPEYLRSLALSDSESLSVEESHFYRNYRVEKERRRQIENLPSGARKSIEQMRASAPAIENRQEVAMLEAKENYEDLFSTAYQKFLEGEETERKEPEPSETGMSFTERLRARLNVENAKEGCFG